MKKAFLICAALLAIAASAEAQSVDIGEKTHSDTNTIVESITKIEYLPPMIIDSPMDTTIVPKRLRRGYPVDYQMPYNMLRRPWEIIVLPGLPACFGYDENYYGVGSRFYEEKEKDIENQ